MWTFFLICLYLFTVAVSFVVNFFYVAWSRSREEYWPGNSKSLFLVLTPFFWPIVWFFMGLSVVNRLLEEKSEELAKKWKKQ